MKTSFILLFLFFSVCTFSQNIDSLKQYANSENYNQKIKALISIADAYFYTRPDSAKIYYQQAILESRKINNHKKEARILLKSGSLDNERGDIEIAAKSFRKALKIAEEINDTALILSSKGNLGNCYLNLGKYEKAIKNYTEVIKIAEKTDNKRVSATGYGALANLYLGKHNYEKALKYYQISEKKFKELKNKNGIALSLMNIATVYSNMGKYNEAILNYKESDKLFREINNYLNSAKCLSGIAKLNRKLKNYKQSVFYETQALKTYKKLDAKMDISYAYNMIATNYTDMKKYKTALKFLDSALNVKGTEKNYVKSEELTDRIRFCYEKLGDYKNAYKYALLHKAYYDSVFNEEKENKFSELEIKFETAKKEQEIELFKKNQEILLKESKNRLILLISVSSFLILLLIILFLFYNRTKLKSQIKESELENKLLRVQMNPHFIFNALTSVEHFIYKNDIQSSVLYISDFAKLMRLILESSRKEFIPLEQEIQILKYYVEFQKLRINYNLNFKIEISENIDIENCLFPPMLIQPFIENAFKHGFKENTEYAYLKISLQLQNNFIFVTIEDNGVGINYDKKDKTDHKSLSIQIAEERLEKLIKKRSKQIKITDLKETNSTLHGTKINFKIPYVEEF